MVSGGQASSPPDGGLHLYDPEFWGAHWGLLHVPDFSFPLALEASPLLFAAPRAHRSPEGMEPGPHRAVPSPCDTHGPHCAVRGLIPRRAGGCRPGSTVAGLAGRQPLGAMASLCGQDQRRHRPGPAPVSWCCVSPRLQPQPCQGSAWVPSSVLPGAGGCFSLLGAPGCGGHDAGGGRHPVLWESTTVHQQHTSWGHVSAGPVLGAVTRQVMADAAQTVPGS